MRLKDSLFTSLTAVTVLAVCAATSGHAQSTASQTAGTGTYVTTDPLANVRYDNKYDLSVAPAYRHIKAGPTLLQGANLGGINLAGTYWFARRIGLEGTLRGYLGTSGAAPNIYDIRGPFIQEYQFAAGPSFLGPHNKHGDLMAHVLAGGTYGLFEGGAHGHVAELGFYNNQLAPVLIVGGNIDLNRSAHWVFRITPDAVMTWYGVQYGQPYRQTDINFAISVGVEYKFKTKR
jgi:hypothetical protein